MLASEEKAETMKAIQEKQKEKSIPYEKVQISEPDNDRDQRKIDDIWPK